MDKETEKDVVDAYNQYAQYERLPILLKRYSFAEKMLVAASYSIHSELYKTGSFHDQIQVFQMPWVLETFVMLAMEASEYDSQSLSGKNTQKFHSMCNAIWDAVGSNVKPETEKYRFTDMLIPVYGALQFQHQQRPEIIMYRYWKLFSNNVEPVKLRERFIGKFGAEYYDYLLLGETLRALFAGQSELSEVFLNQHVFRYLLQKRFPKVAENLLISREKYKTLQRRFAGDKTSPNCYLSSLCPSVQYPFVEESGQIYIPLPHLICQNVTSSLLYRLTEGNNKLREQIGKQVLEQYVLKLIRRATIYDEVHGEKDYVSQHSPAKSPDVMARSGNNVLLLDSKSTVPNLQIRLADEGGFDKNIRIVAENLKKLYKQARQFEKYNPFCNIDSVSQDQIWGVVLVLEDAFISRRLYFKKAAEMLEIKTESAEWEYFTLHFKVFSFYDVERISLCGCSVIDACKSMQGDNRFDYSASGFPPKESSLTNSDYIDFKNRLSADVERILWDMHAEGCF